MKDGKNDPVYQQLARQIADDRQALDAMKKSLRGEVEKQTEATLMVRRSDRESADSDKRLDEASRMRGELQGQKILEQRLQAEYDKELRNVKQFSGNTLDLEFKHDELARAEKVFELIAARSLQLQTEQMAPNRVSLLRTAACPVRPSNPTPCGPSPWRFSAVFACPSAWRSPGKAGFAAWAIPATCPRPTEWWS